MTLDSLILLHSGVYCVEMLMCYLSYFCPVRSLFFFFRDETFVRLDLKGNSLCQRLQFVANPVGSTHEEAVRLTTDSSEDEKPESEKLENSHFVLPSSMLERRKSPEEESEKLLETLVSSVVEDDSVVQLHSVQCLRVVLALAVPGTLVLTTTTMAFTADDSSSEYEKASCLVREEKKVLHVP